MRILINTPSLNLLGGVANHYEGLRAFWTENVRYNTVGKRSEKNGSGKYWLPWDLLKFLHCLLVFRPDVVLLNPSLGKSALKRDFFFQKVARSFGFKTVLFIHGFDWDYVQVIDRVWAIRNFNKASLIFVLANAFKTELQSWGVTSPICFSTTKVNDALLNDYNVQKERTGEVKNILFLSRVEKVKGVFIAIDTYCILKERYPHLSLTIAGDGSDLPKVKKLIEDDRIPDVVITGRLSGNDLINAYKNADLSSSSSYGEGMPTAVLEAMAFGLPVFTRNVGGLPDFFEDEKMGYITDSLDPIDFANAMVPYIESSELTRKVALYNAQYAKDHFMASSVAKQIENQISLFV
jgi:glycosyltransferase involved in cell wall biosynthesis